MKSSSTGVRVCAGVVSAVALAATVAAQPPPPRQERVSFAAGASSATLKGTLKGSSDVDYVVRASAGQTLTVSFKASNASANFNVLPPGSADAAMYVSQTGGDYTTLLPADGDYKIRLYLVRAAARRNEASSYTITIGVTGKALAPLPASQDAKVPGTPYHATGPIMCIASPYSDTTLKPCDAFVIRRGRDGTATVEIDLGAAGRRRILFVQGKPVVADAQGMLTATRKDDTTTVTFESGERHDIPDALVTGG
jgi:hypothetical protein